MLLFNPLGLQIEVSQGRQSGKFLIRSKIIVKIVVQRMGVNLFDNIKAIKENYPHIDLTLTIIPMFSTIQ